MSSDTMFVVVEIRTEHNEHGVASVMRVVGRDKEYNPDNDDFVYRQITES